MLKPLPKTNLTGWTEEENGEGKSFKDIPCKDPEKQSNKTNNKIVYRYRITQNENMEGLESKLNLCLNLPLGQNKSLKKIFLNITVLSKAIIILLLFEEVVFVL